MKLPLPLFLALRHLRPRRTFVSVITLLSVMGVTLAVMVLIVVLSVMAGFEKELRDKIIGFNAHMFLTNNRIIENPEQWVDLLKKQPEVLGAAPYVTGPIVVRFHDQMSTPILRGIDPEAEETVVPIKKYIKQGDGTLEGDSIWVGKEWAARNGAFVGDKVEIYAPRQLASLDNAGKNKQTLVLPTELIITGVFESGLYDYDLNFMVTSLENAQYLYNLPSGVHGISIRVRDPSRMDELQRRLDALLVYPMHTRTWMQQNQYMFDAIGVERVAMTFILFFIMIVAAFGLCSTLITITVQKTREIGVLKALGATDGQVRMTFLLHGLIVGVIGALLGVGAAEVVLLVRNSFRQFLVDHFGINVFRDSIYQLPQIPAEVSSWQVVLIALAGVVVCVLAALVPAQSAARLQPSRALRYE